jgi:hypothetical protein
MAKRSYVAGMRTFEITLLETSAKNRSSWIVERVIETSRSHNEPIVIPTMESILATTEDEALARACDRIDKWLFAHAWSPTEDTSVTHHSSVDESPTARPQPACPRCGSHRMRIVGQSGQPPLVHYRCEYCRHISSRERGDE